MSDTVADFTDDLFDTWVHLYVHDELYNAYSVFEKLLTEYGLMIVPIEDPTNLRYGSDE